jgi:hypothetical protein
MDNTAFRQSRPAQPCHTHTHTHARLPRFTTAYDKLTPQQTISPSLILPSAVKPEMPYFVPQRPDDLHLVDLRLP